MSLSQVYKVFVPLMGASVTVDQIRTELSIHEYGILVCAEFLPLVRKPKWCNNAIAPNDIKSAVLTIRRPMVDTDLNLCRENYLYWEIQKEHSRVLKPAIFKDPVFEFWHLRKYQEPYRNDVVPYNSMVSLYKQMQVLMTATVRMVDPNRDSNFALYSV